MAWDFIVSVNGDSRIGAHQGTNGAAGARFGFFRCDDSGEIAFFVHVGRGSEDTFGAGMDTEAAPFTFPRINDDVAGTDALSNNHLVTPLGQI